MFSFSCRCAEKGKFSSRTPGGLALCEPSAHGDHSKRVWRAAAGEQECEGVRSTRKAESLKHRLTHLNG